MRRGLIPSRGVWERCKLEQRGPGPKNAFAGSDSACAVPRSPLFWTQLHSLFPGSRHHGSFRQMKIHSQLDLKETSTHKSAKTHSGTVVAPLGLFIRTHGGTFSVSILVILAVSVFEISCVKTDRQTHRQTNAGEMPTPQLPFAWVIRY